MSDITKMDINVMQCGWIYVDIVQDVAVACHKGGENQLCHLVYVMAIATPSDYKAFNVKGCMCTSNPIFYEGVFERIVLISTDSNISQQLQYLSMLHIILSHESLQEHSKQVFTNVPWKWNLNTAK